MSVLMTQQTYSSNVFVGRQHEMSMMDEMLHTKVYKTLPEDKLLPEWILSIHGAGGVGKTQLLRHFLKDAEAHHLDEKHHTVKLTHNPIDLYLSQHQTEPGILRSLSEQLSEECFKEFREKYPKIRNEEDIRALFLKCYRKLPGDHIVLLFDTLERASNAALRFFREFLPLLREGSDKGKFGTFVVIAGRKPLNLTLQSRNVVSHGMEASSSLIGVKNYLLKGLSREDVQDYFNELTPKRQQRRITPEFLDRVTILSKGRPILIALIIDWLNHGNLPQEFPDPNSSKEEFEQLLVEQVCELRTSEDQSIWAMAHLNRRFDGGFVQAILGFSEQEAQETISLLTEFSFVKSHGSTESNDFSCTLHDEMQDLVKKYILEQFDVSGDLRKEWSQKAVEYYGDLIAQSSREDFQYRRMLERERLFYWLQADVDKALDYWRYLYRKARFPYEKESLNYEVSSFKDKLSIEDKLELQFRESLTLHDHLQYDLSLKEFNKVLEKTTDETLKGEIYPWVIHSLIHLGAIEKGLEKGKIYEAWFKNLLASAHTDQFYSKIESLLGQLLNAIGLAYLIKSDYRNAIKYYSESIEKLSFLPENDIHIVSTRTNLAFLYHAMGKDRIARAYGKAALKISERSSNRRQSGLAHHVLGTIAANSLREQQAVNNFQRALNYLSQSEDARGLAMVKVSMGRMYRQIGWYKVKPDRKEFESALNNYKKASVLFEEALKHIGDSNPEIMMEIYYEQATLFREKGSFDKAVELYQESKSIAEEISSPLKIARNLLGLGVTYNLKGEYLKSRNAAARAAEVSDSLDSTYLNGCSERILTDVLYNEDKDYDRAIDKAVESCVKVLSSDMLSFTNSPAKRELLHDEWLEWLTDDLIQNLPSKELRSSKSQELIERLKTDESFAKYYPGLEIILRELIERSED